MTEIQQLCKENQQQKIQSLIDSSGFYPAMILLEDYLKRYPGDVWAFFASGHCSYELKKIDKAEKYLLKALELCTDFAPAFCLLGDIYLVCKKKPSKAIFFYQKALEIDPTNDKIYAQISQAYYFCKNYTDAQQSARKALKLNQDNAIAYMVLALCFEQQKKFSQAKEFYEIAIQKAPNHSTILNNMGRLLLNHGKTKAAYKLYLAALKLDPEDPIIKINFKLTFYKNHPFYSPINWVTCGYLTEDTLIKIFLWLVGLYIVGFIVLINIVYFFFNAQTDQILGVYGSFITSGIIPFLTFIILLGLWRLLVSIFVWMHYKHTLKHSLAHENNNAKQYY
jgi:tetratricopeptide (TPR) repeat protein